MSKETADYIECPHCQYQHGDYHEYLEVGDMAGDFEMKCEKCKLPFNVDFYSIFYFTTTK